MSILSRSRRLFVGSMKNLVICQFWRWHYTKSQFRSSNCILFGSPYFASHCNALMLFQWLTLNSAERVYLWQNLHKRSIFLYGDILKWKRLMYQIDLNAPNLLTVTFGMNFRFIYRFSVTTCTIYEPKCNYKQITQLQMRTIILCSATQLMFLYLFSIEAWPRILIIHAYPNKKDDDLFVASA